EDEHHGDAPRSPDGRTRAGEETGEADGDEPESDGQGESAGAFATGTCREVGAGGEGRWTRAIVRGQGRAGGIGVRVHWSCPPAVGRRWSASTAARPGSSVSPMRGSPVTDP